MIIDGHGHAFGEYLNTSSIIKTLDENKTDAVVLCPGILNRPIGYSVPDLSLKYPEKDLFYSINKFIKLSVSLTRKAKQINTGNKYVYSLACENPDRVFQFYWINPNEKNTFEKMKEKYNIWKFKGIKLHQCWNKFSLTDKKIHEISSWAGHNKLPVFIHISTKKDAQHLVELINQHQHTNFIIAHLIGLEVFIESKFKYDNFYFDMSSSHLFPQRKLLLAVSVFGPNKIILGSDTPAGNNNLKNSISSVNNLPIPKNQRELILGENLRKLLNV